MTISLASSLYANSMTPNHDLLGNSSVERFFNAVLMAFEMAARASEQVYPCRIMDTVFRLRIAGNTVERLIFPALSHLSVDAPDSDEPFTVCIWDSAGTGIPFPPIPWEYAPDRCTLDYGVQGEIRGFNDARFGAIHIQWFEQVILIDRQRRIGIVWFGDANTQPYWERAFPLRLLFHLWSRDTDAQLLHAAAVGTPEGGALLLGVSGAGKSSTALSFVRKSDDPPHPFRLAGDDYTAVRLHNDGTPTVYSLYSIAKLHWNNVTRFPHFTDSIINADHPDDEKAILNLNSYRPESLIASFPLKAILLPTITGAAHTRILPATPFEALFTAAPATVFHLIGAKKTTLKKLAALVRRVPVYRVELGMDRREIVESIAAFLESQ